MKKILINNFFSGYLHRGIPVYCDNLAFALNKLGYECVQLRMPRLWYKLPRGLINILFVLFEQCYVPLYAWFSRATVTIYPYNSIALLGALSPKSVMVVHDFIPNKKTSFAALYIRISQQFACALKRKVFFVSQAILRQANIYNCFPACEKRVLLNGFYRFESLIAKTSPSDEKFILLCSGRGENKDFHGALMLYLQSGLYRQLPLRVIGMSGDRSMLARPEFAAIQQHVTIYSQIADEDIVALYHSCSFVWAHSLNEGYGRTIAEGKLAGKLVLASDIATFKEQRDEFVWLYRDGHDFKQGLAAMERFLGQGFGDAFYSPRAPQEHHQIESELNRLLKRGNGE